MGWSECDVDVAGVRLRSYRRGSGVPLVVAHGFSDSAMSWTRVAERLEDEFEVIAYDARCHGASEAVPYVDRSGGDDMVGLIEVLGLDRPFVMGHSMGAMTSFMAAV